MDNSEKEPLRLPEDWRGFQSITPDVDNPFWRLREGVYCALPIELNEKGSYEAKLEVVRLEDEQVVWTDYHDFDTCISRQQLAAIFDRPIDLKSFIENRDCGVEKLGEVLLGHFIEVALDNMWGSEIYLVISKKEESEDGEFVFTLYIGDKSYIGEAVVSQECFNKYYADTTPERAHTRNEG